MARRTGSASHCQLSRSYDAHPSRRRDVMQRQSVSLPDCSAASAYSLSPLALLKRVSVQALTTPQLPTQVLLSRRLCVPPVGTCGSKASPRNPAGGVERSPGKPAVCISAQTSSLGIGTRAQKRSPVPPLATGRSCWRSQIRSWAIPALRHATRWIVDLMTTDEASDYEESSYGKRN